MKHLVAGAAALLTTWLAVPAHAHVVEVTTMVSVADAQDEAKLRAAVQAAIDGVLIDIAFTPTLVVLTRAVVVGDRVYVRVLVADEEGERAMRQLTDGDVGATAPDRRI
jgi:hypothetical protein